MRGWRSLRCSLSLETTGDVSAKICSQWVTTQVFNLITGFVRMWKLFNIRTNVAQRHFSPVIGGGVRGEFVF